MIEVSTSDGSLEPAWSSQEEDAYKELQVDDEALLIRAVKAARRGGQTPALVKSMNHTERTRLAALVDDNFKPVEGFAEAFRLLLVDYHEERKSTQDESALPKD